MSAEQPTGKGTVHNFKNEWKFSYEIKQKASGELYFGSMKAKADDDFGLVSLIYKAMREFKEMAQENGFKWVKGLEGSN